jgi:hypothetical protein
MSSFVNGALDSSPISLPPKKQPTLDEVASRPQTQQLKRSASTASLTLPTPKTERRKTKQRVKSPSPEQSEDDDMEPRATSCVGKLDFSAVDGDESSDDELFYHDGDEKSAVKFPRESVQGSAVAPITPPASRRQTQTSTARRRKREEDDFENPFLETPAGKVRPKLETAADEFPTVVDANGEPQLNHYV